MKPANDGHFNKEINQTPDDSAHTRTPNNKKREKEIVDTYTDTHLVYINSADSV